MAIATLLLLFLSVTVDSFSPSIFVARQSGAHRRGASTLASTWNPRSKNANTPWFANVGSTDGWTQHFHHSREGLAGRMTQILHRTVSTRLHESASTTAQHNEASSSSSSSPSPYHPRMGELTPPEAKVYQLLHELHAAGFAFRVVVVGGRGSIAEFTVPRLGPKLSIAQSPSTGANLLTLASDDSSWEYHVQLSEVFKVALVEKPTPAKTLRIIRLVNSTGDTVSSLILVPDFVGHERSEEEAIQWFHGLVEKYGSEVQL